MKTAYEIVKDWESTEKLKAEYHYLRWFWENAHHAFGPADADIYAMFEEDYERETKKKPMIRYPND